MTSKRAKKLEPITCGVTWRIGVLNIHVGGTSMKITNDYTLQNEDPIERTC